MIPAMHAIPAPVPRSFVPPLRRRWLAALAGLALFLGGCAELPAQVERPVSKAWAAPESTALGTLTQGLRQSATTGNASGFLLLSGAQEAYTARLALVATSVADLEGKLELVLARLADPTCRSIEGRSGIYYTEAPLYAPGALAFLFPGQGAQYPNMLADLCVRFPAARYVP